MRRALSRAATVAALTLATAALVAGGEASAHTAHITLTTSCADVAGDGWIAHGTITNDTGFGAAKVTTSRPTTPAVSMLESGASASFTVQSPASVGTASVTATLTWADGVHDSATASVYRPRYCPPPPTYGSVVVVDCQHIIVRSDTPGAAATVSIGGVVTRVRLGVPINLPPHGDALPAVVTITAEGHSPKVIRVVIPKCQEPTPTPTTPAPTTPAPTTPAPTVEPTSPAPTTTEPAPVPPPTIGPPTRTAPRIPVPSPSLSPVGNNTGELPNTGTSTWLLLAGGLLCLGFGVGLMRFGRRRRAV